MASLTVRNVDHILPQKVTPGHPNGPKNQQNRQKQVQETVQHCFCPVGSLPSLTLQLDAPRMSLTASSSTVRPSPTQTIFRDGSRNYTDLNLNRFFTDCYCIEYYFRSIASFCTKCKGCTRFFSIIIKRALFCGDLHHFFVIFFSTCHPPADA